MKHLGRHLIIEFWGCENLNSPKVVKEALKNAALACGATLLGLKTYQFEPHGVSGVAIIAESHISIHTWPELGYAAIDIFTCGESTAPYRATEVLKHYFQPDYNHVLELIRGVDTVSLPRKAKTVTAIGGEHSARR